MEGQRHHRSPRARSTVSTGCLRGFAKFKKFPKNLDGAQPTHPPQPNLFLSGNPSLAWTEHSNQNNQQLLAMYVQTEYTWYTTPKYQYWFRAILGRFSNKQTKSEWDLDPPTPSIVILDFWNFSFFAKLLIRISCHQLLILIVFFRRPLFAHDLLRLFTLLLISLLAWLTMLSVSSRPIRHRGSTMMPSDGHNVR